ncbi:MAG: ornithine carbamoyltransferase [Candidatus Eisenbacteria bacterium]|nr:ornithine carbamoyltransferase [Candidatus Eisenbacteria bacterium]
MSVNLKNRHFLEFADLTRAEARELLDLSHELKRNRSSRRGALSGNSIVLIFEKTSTRTRCAFEVAAHELGMGVTYLDPSGSQIGHKESIRDTARVLGRMYQAIEYRGYEQRVVDELAAWAGVPVFNGLTDDSHPTQMLADLMTMEEEAPGRPLESLKFAYLGDSRNNMGNSLLLAGALMGMDVRICGPKDLWPRDAVQQRAKVLARDSGARITLTDDPKTAVAGVDYVYTDVWVSLGEPPAKWGERIQLLKPYQVNAALMAATGNPNAKFLHCLPAFHNRDTTKGEELFHAHGMDGLEVTDDVFESSSSVVFSQAENRLHTIKALLLSVLG